MDINRFVNLNLGDAPENIPENLRIPKDYPWVLSQERKPTTVAVIGGGMAGLAAAKYLLAERVKGTKTNYFAVTVFERQSEVAGVWNLSTANDYFQTPMYEDLEANVPRDMMTYHDFPYPECVSIFPLRKNVKQYLESYSEEIRHCIKLNSEVTRVAKVTRNYMRKWEVTSKAPGTQETSEEFFDTVLVATGTFNQIYLPPDLGLDAWEERHPGSLFHSQKFHALQKDPEKFKDKKVLIIGRGPSYFDISRRISPDVKGDILVSTGRPLPENERSSKNQRIVPLVKQLIPMNKGTGSVCFVDDTTEHDVDIILLCTGYQYDFEFLPKLHVNPNGQRICGIWNQMLLIRDPTMAFVGLPKMSATFTVAEVQSAYIARLWSHRISSPSMKAMQELVADDIRKLEEDLKKNEANGGSDTDSTRAFHSFPHPRDKEYIHKLWLASNNADKEGNPGKQPPDFSPYYDWIRSIRVELRSKFFMKKQQERQTITSFEALGFVYDKSKSSL